MTLKKLNDKYPGKKAFITGAGSGLGSAFARLLASNGWELFLVDLDLEALANFAETLPKSSRVHVFQLNVAKKSDFMRVTEKIQALTGEIDLLINNAGIGDGELMRHYTPEAWERVIQVNLLGVFYGVHFLLPLLLEKGGMIVNVGSAAGFMNGPGMSAYNVSKAGVYSFSETLYHELRADNVHVSVVTPTFFRSNIASAATGAPKFAHFVEKQMQYSKTNADEIAEVVLTQASKGKFQIIHPTDARRSFFMKKWFPKLVDRQLQRMAAKFSS